MSADREMIADLLSALEHHQEQTRPIAMTRTAIVAAQHHLRSAAPDAPAAEPVALTDEQVRAICYVGPVYAPDGVVRRTAYAYRKELEEARLYGIRETERAHGIGAPHD